MCRSSPLTPLEILALFVAGVGMGAINNLSGGGGVLGLIALDFAGLATRDANAALRPAALSLALSGLLGFRTRGLTVPKEVWSYGLATVPGAVLGAIFAVSLPLWVYRGTLFLLVLAVLLRELRGRGPARSTEEITRPGAMVATFFFTGLGLHMGFIQVAFGLLCMLVLGRFLGRDLVRINAAKMAIVVCASSTSLLTLALLDAIRWPPALAVAAGAGLGSFLAGRWSVRKGHGAVRSVVLVICVVLMLRLIAQLIFDR